jgi:hypothetical protein
VRTRMCSQSHAMMNEGTADRIHDNATRGDHTNDGAKRLASATKDDDAKDDDAKDDDAVDPAKDIPLPEDLVGAKTSECLIELEVSLHALLESFRALACSHIISSGELHFLTLEA